MDGISVGEGIHPSFDFDFSVDRAPFNGGATVGGVSCFGGPDVTTEAFLGEAQGDIFNTGSLPLSPFGCNAQVTDEAILGLIAPNPVAPGVPPLDDIDALTEEIVGAGPCTLSGGFTPITTCPAMTISPTSALILGGLIPPSALFPFPPADAASILVPPATPAIPPEIPAVGCAAYSGGFPCMAVHSSVLGLSPADDIDALCWFDINGNGLPDPPYWAAPAASLPGDMYAFSLTPLSPAPFSPADILIPTPFGPPAVLSSAASLGLLATDDVDALMCHSDDTDLDGFPDMVDNCPSTLNPSQADIDADGIGNACDTEGPSPNSAGLGGADDCADGVDNDFDGLTDGFDPPCDMDLDTVADIVDNCPATFNPGQSNVDGDGFGDACDTEGPSPNSAGSGGVDDCGDGVDNDGDTLIDGFDPLCDGDGDTIADIADNCPTTPNPIQSDVDFDLIGDLCDTEGPSPNSDGAVGLDDCIDAVDNDGDGLTDGFDPTCDMDGDTIADIVDNCPSTFNTTQADVDGDGIGDACDTEGPPGNTNGSAGGDDCLDGVDNDGDFLIDGADPGCAADSDGDGQPDAVDSCPFTFTSWTTPLGDTDCDSFLDTIEVFVGTDPLDSCANTAGANNDVDDRWPADTNDDQIVTVFDLVPYIPALNSVAPGPPYSVRLDLNTDAKISVFDLVPFIQLLNEPCGGAGATAVSAGFSHSCAVTTGGGVQCWGSNGSGELGDGTNSPSNTRVNVSGLGSGVAAVSAGDTFTCAVTTGGGVQCWGSNGSGELGDGTNSPSNTPVNVSGLGSGVAAVSAGDSHACALTTGGGVQCWGSNGSGQLGDGTLLASNTPVNVVGLGSGVAAVSAGVSHTCALTTGGGVQCWGRNTSGQLGDGTNGDSSTPVSVSGLGSGVAAVSAGFDHTCALTTGGGVQCWGGNSSGQLGDGTNGASNTPVSVSGLGSGVAAVSAGYDHTCALTTGGGAQCWGANGSGELGDGTNGASNTPVNVVGLGSGVAAVSAGGDHTCALTTAAGIECWGRNVDGQLGDGTNGASNTPVSVVGFP